MKPLLEAEGLPDVLAAVSEVDVTGGDGIAARGTSKQPVPQAAFPLRPADRPDQRLLLRFAKALLHVEVSGGVIDHRSYHGIMLPQGKLFTRCSTFEGPRLHPGAPPDPPPSPSGSAASNGARPSPC